jgi:uncharacterized membrane protein YeaQ/YmgE (transglycosylase-associated protein family)
MKLKSRSIPIDVVAGFALFAPHLGTE